MPYRLLADIVVVLHLAFVVFVVLGGLLAARWPAVAWVHVPAAIWGAVVECAGLICPLTPLEHWLRMRGGQASYGTSFVEHYLVPLLYPAALTPSLQLVLGGLVVGINLVIYAAVWHRRRTLC